jgi:hypothetical protein
MERMPPVSAVRCREEKPVAATLPNKLKRDKHNHQQDTNKGSDEKIIGDRFQFSCGGTVGRTDGEKRNDAGRRKKERNYRGEFVNPAVLRFIGNVKRRDHEKAESQQVGGGVQDVLRCGFCHGEIRCTVALKIVFLPELQPAFTHAWFAKKKNAIVFG